MAPILDDDESIPEDVRPANQFQPGNRLWELAVNPGRKLNYTPKRLMQRCLDYFKWIEENPLYESKAFAYEGTITLKKVPKMRAMTLEGLSVFLGTGRQSWYEWGQPGHVLSDVVTWANSVIREQKFTGAAADLLNATVISRDLGLADRSEISGPNGGPIQTRDVTAEALIEQAHRLGLDPTALGLALPEPKPGEAFSHGEPFDGDEIEIEA